MGAIPASNEHGVSSTTFIRNHAFYMVDYGRMDDNPELNQMEPRKEYMEKYRKVYRAKQLEVMLNELPQKSCVLCGSTQNLTFHEIYGRKHPDLYKKGGLEYLKANKADFVLLCGKHHWTLHNIVRFGRNQALNDECWLNWVNLINVLVDAIIREPKKCNPQFNPL
jgi:hypothetical protein